MRSVSGAPKRSVVRNAPTLASARGTPKKIKNKNQTISLNLTQNHAKAQIDPL
ncbi:MAG: hypothetical protein RML38_07895 [Bacteroidia bacterium]|nr:hypothetical protein [Bacteroidia bacterium]